MYKNKYLLIILNQYRISLLAKPFTQNVTAPKRCLCLSFSTRALPIIQITQKSRTLTFVREYAKGAIVKDKKGKSGKPKVPLSDEELTEVLNPVVMRLQMQNVVDKLKSDYITTVSVRSTGSIETLPVKIEGDDFPLNEIAQLFRKNPELVVINMTNFPEGLKPVMEALTNCGMNISPQQDGTFIYVPLPKVTREHRQNLATNAKTLMNKAKDRLKDIQNRFIKDAKKQDTLSEDLIFNVTENVRYVCELYIQEAEKLFKSKEKELLGE